MKKGAPATSSTSSPAPVAPIPRPASSATVSSGPVPALPSAEDLARRVAEAQKRVAEAQKNLAIKDNPYLVRCPRSSVSVCNLPVGFKAGLQANKSKKGTPLPELSQQGAGLKMAAHPLLLDTTPSAPQSKKDRYKPMQPKFASIKVRISQLILMSQPTRTFRQTSEMSQLHRPPPRLLLSLPLSSLSPTHTPLAPARRRERVGLKAFRVSASVVPSGSTRRASTCNLRTNCARRHSSRLSSSVLRTVRRRLG